MAKRTTPAPSKDKKSSTPLLVLVVLLVVVLVVGFALTRRPKQPSPEEMSKGPQMMREMLQRAQQGGTTAPEGPQLMRQLMQQSQGGR